MAAGSYDYVIVGAGYALRRYVGRPMAPWPARSMTPAWRGTSANTPRRPTTRRGPVAWAPAMAPSSTVNYGCTAWTACGWWTPR